MKKGYVSQINQERDSVIKVSESIIKILTRQQEIEFSNQLSQQHKKQSYLKCQQEKIQNAKKIIQSLRTHVEKLKTNSVRYLIYLIATDIFNQTLDNMERLFTPKKYLTEFTQNPDPLEPYKKQAFSVVSQIYRFSLKQVPSFLSIFCNKQAYTYLTQIQKNEKQQQQLNQQISEAYIKKQKQQQIKIELFKEILNKVSEIVMQKQKSNNIINEALKMVIRYQSRDERNDDIYEDIAVNWLKFKLDDSRKQKDNFCCKSVFFLDDLFQYVKKKIYEFKPFTKTQDNPKLLQEQQQLSQTIAAFMNQKGGVIFLGVNNDSKFYKIAGFQLEEKNKKQLVKHIINAVNGVYPKHKGFEQSSEQSQHYYNAAYELNYYISIEFMKVVRRNTFENCRDPVRTYQKLYICKITVKMGHPRYFYYVLKNEGNKDDKNEAQIHIFSRTEQGNEKQTLQKNYDEIYIKLIKYENDKKSIKVPNRLPMHDGCLYDMSMKAQNFILETQEKDSDDD